MKIANRLSFFVLLAIAMTAQLPTTVRAADRLIGLHSAQVMSQSMPWIAREAGLFRLGRRAFGSKHARRGGKKRDGRNRGIADTKRGKHARLLPEKSDLDVRMAAVFRRRPIEATVA